jgi:tRNA (cytosine38-C5)-methyltransferase
MIEFFSGIGGMRLAVRNAMKHQGALLQHCQAYDISIHANRTYKHNFPDDLVSTKLVEQLKPPDLNGKADLWTMSPPCQPFTTTLGAKNLDVEDKRCNGLKAIMKLLSDIQDKPRHILLENVKGFATSQMIELFYECLKFNGYTWKEYLISPVQFGIPNHRQRYYILCERSERWIDLQPTEPRDAFHDDDDDDDSNVTTNPPSMRRIGEYLHHSNSNIIMTDAERKDLMVSQTVLEQPWAKHLGIVTAMDQHTHCFTAGYGRILHRATGSLLLMPKGDDDDSDDSKERIATRDLDRSDMTLYHGRLRRFSPRELLNLFGFPADFDFTSDISLENRYKLIGNSINVTLVTELIKELLSSSFTNKEQMTNISSSTSSSMVGDE